MHGREKYWWENKEPIEGYYCNYTYINHQGYPVGGFICGHLRNVKDLEGNTIIEYCEKKYKLTIGENSIIKRPKKCIEEATLPDKPWLIKTYAVTNWYLNEPTELNDYNIPAG